MKRVYLIFMGSLLLTMGLLGGNFISDWTTQLFIAACCMAMLGIPHGAIDHILYMEGRSDSPVLFYAFYLGLIGVYAACWIVFPSFSFIVFLLLSAYHFGESQFSNLQDVPKNVLRLLSLFWGIGILTALHFYNVDELLQLSALWPDTPVILEQASIPVMLAVLLGSTVLVLLLLVWLWRKGYITFEKVLAEVYVLFLVHACFYILPLLIGFTLYFTLLHSLRVLSEEFRYLKDRRRINLWQFVRLLLPYTAVSIGGMALLVVLSQQGIIQASALLLFFILISALTLPHSIVMNDFYHNLFGKSR